MSDSLSYYERAAAKALGGENRRGSAMVTNAWQELVGAGAIDIQKYLPANEVAHGEQVQAAPDIQHQYRHTQQQSGAPYHGEQEPPHQQPQASASPEVEIGGRNPAYDDLLRQRNEIILRLEEELQLKSQRVEELEHMLNDTVIRWRKSTTMALTVISGLEGEVARNLEHITSLTAYATSMAEGGDSGEKSFPSPQRAASIVALRTDSNVTPLVNGEVPVSQALSELIAGRQPTPEKSAAPVSQVARSQNSPVPSVSSAAAASRKTGVRGQLRSSHASSTGMVEALHVSEEQAAPPSEVSPRRPPPPTPVETTLSPAATSQLGAQQSVPKSGGLQIAPSSTSSASQKKSTAPEPIISPRSVKSPDAAALRIAKRRTKNSGFFVSGSSSDAPSQTIVALESSAEVNAGGGKNLSGSIDASPNSFAATSTQAGNDSSEDGMSSLMNFMAHPSVQAALHTTRPIPATNESSDKKSNGLPERRSTMALLFGGENPAVNSSTPAASTPRRGTMQLLFQDP